MEGTRLETRHISLNLHFHPWQTLELRDGVVELQKEKYELLPWRYRRDRRGGVTSVALKEESVTMYTRCFLWDLAFVC